MPSISVTVAVTEIDGKSGEVIEESRFTTSREVFERRFSGTEPMLMAIEVDTYSPWVSRILERCGHEALVANAKKVSLIYGEGHKTYKIYTEKLARFDLKLLSPIKHRAARTLSAIWRLCTCGTRWWEHGRTSSTTVKAFAARLPKCTARSFHHKVAAHLPKELAPTLGAVLEIIASLSERSGSPIAGWRRWPMSCIQRRRYCSRVFECERSLLAFVLILEDPSRFAKSRRVRPCLGLVPTTDQSGGSDPQKRISKHGNELTRKILRRGERSWEVLSPTRTTC